ncbi:MAG: hypothetical protein NZ847_00610 [Acidobacteria bacterium]|nr:hypothetical protein [Acidobacteriota bacterium]
MRHFNRCVRYLLALFVITTLTSGCKTLEIKAQESYEFWRIRTGNTNVATFYTENGLQETCHGFWAKDYRETDPESPCFAGTTAAGVVETEEDVPLADDPPISTTEPLVEEPVQAPQVIETEPVPEPVIEVEAVVEVEPVVEVDPVVEVEPAPQKKNPEAEDKEPTKELTGVTETGIGQELVPEKPAAAVPKKPWTPSPLTLWVVHKGEHLWGISAHRLVYGDPYQWPLLFKRNRHQIVDADLIYPGQVLHIERNLSTAEIDRAIEHAKTRGAWILGITELSDLEYLSRERSYQ